MFELVGEVRESLGHVKQRVLGITVDWITSKFVVVFVIGSLLVRHCERRELYFSGCRRCCSTFLNANRRGVFLREGSVPHHPTKRCILALEKVDARSAF